MRRRSAVLLLVPYLVIITSYCSCAHVLMSNMNNSVSRFFQKDTSAAMTSDTDIPASKFQLNRLPTTKAVTAQEASSSAKIEKTDFDECLRRAKYELEHDAYRGIKTLLNEELLHETVPTSPWQVCQFGSASAASLPHETSFIESVYQCSCPTLHDWCEEIIIQKKKNTSNKSRKKSLIRKKHYGCDTNPFCLLSSGGVLEDILRERLQAFGQEILADHQSIHTAYQAETQHFLDRVRTSFRVPTERVRNYLHGLLGQERVEECMRAVKKHNDHLVFSLEEAIEQPDSESMIMSRPPGMENLGATCYLNTQLQCLAQNLSFVDGILSLQSDGDDRMSDIMRQFQKLLRDMTLGPWKEVNTVSFTQSLGLDHAEQQDPNEFSRLFLDKLHTSFLQQQTASEDLLPFLFQGVQQYETICSGCGTVSKRPEEFMDLNLPIISKKTGTGSVLEMISDPSVQDCFEAAYSKEETLEGDNQYFCDTCQGKRDATRRVAFQKLPPVLNIQLNRYIYNMQTLMKQKVEQQVLLNVTFQIKDRKYRLVAVMRHKGRSAYHGHYIAEAMDWCTGLWFEFNDTAVTWLENGPRNSSDLNKKVPAGSSDAYNMYYVEEEFLAQSVWEASLRRSRQQPSPLYHDLHQLCYRDQQIWQDLQERKQSIHEKLNIFQKLNSSAVWIDNGTWQHFLDCQTDTLASYQTCPHNQGLSPRQARQGKLLPASVYKAYCQLANQQNVDEERLVTPKQHLFCEQCTKDYQQQIAEKVNMIKTAQRVLKAVQQNNPEPTDLDDPYTFVVSKKFITLFKAGMAKLAKAVNAANDDLDDVDVAPFFGEVAVNRSITCEHGNCEITNKRRVTYVSRSIWSAIKQLYPSSIEHKRPFPSAEDDYFACPQCSADSTALDTRREYLSELLRFKIDTCRPDEALELERNKDEDSDSDSDYSYRIIHSDDWTIWNRFLQAAKRQLNSGEISDQAKAVLKPANAWDLNKYTSIGDVSGTTAEFLSNTIHPFVCRAHGLPIESAIFRTKDTPYRLNEAKLLILGEPAYKKLTSHWERVAREVLVTVADTETTSPVQWLHPSFRRQQQRDTGTSFVISSDQVSMRFTLESQVCTDPECNSNYCTWLNSCKTPGSAAHEPIAIDMDVMSPPGLTLSVYEVEPGTSMENFLADKNSSPEDSSSPADLVQSLRRSTRKRKSRYPRGCILSEESLKVNLQSNVAALRLLLLERCTAGTLYEVSHTVQLIVPPDEAKGWESLLIDLPLDKSNEKLEDVISEGLKTPFAEIPTSRVCNICITRQNLEMAGKLPKEALLDHFMSLSSDVQPDRKKRHVERGFTGTFLSSVSKSDDNNSMVVAENDKIGSDVLSDTDKPSEEDEDEVSVCVIPNTHVQPFVPTKSNDVLSDDNSIAVIEPAIKSVPQSEHLDLTSSPHNTRGGLITVDSEDDDDGILNGGPVFQNSPDKKTREESRRERQLKQRCHDLVRLLEQNPDIVNRSNMMIAAEKAVLDQPDLAMDELLMYAYCHYSEIQSTS